MHIRPFNFDSTEDYAAIVAIGNAIWTDDPSTVDSRRHWDSVREEKYRFQRFVVENGQGVLGYGAWGDRDWAYEPGKFFIGIEVHPRHQGRGLGTRLYNYLADQVVQAGPETISITSFTREDQDRGQRFLEDRGFSQVMRFNRSRLDVQAFDSGRFMRWVERARQAGIAIKSLAQLAEEVPDWQRKYYDLEVELGKDVPYHDEFTPLAYETYVQGVLGSPNFYPEAAFVALDGERWVGTSALWRNTAKPQRLGTGLTGVSRSHRRLGVATAMKVAAISFAQEKGITEIDTDNEENNPMYQINVQLGFEPVPASLDFLKEF